VDVLTDPNNCGACGHGCSLSGTTARACVGGTCNPTCTGNSGDCRTPAASEADDGCETNLLTNPTSCGVCGHDCLEGLCVSARCQPAELVVGVSLSGPLAVDSQYVHWIEGNVIARTPISGIGALPVAQGQDNAFAITSDGTYVFWFRENTASAVPFNGFITYMKSGTTDFHNFLSRLKPAAIAADGTNLYWVDQVDGKIHQAARDGTGATTISPALDGLMSLATDGVSVFAGLSGSTVVGLASVPVGGGTLVETAALTTTPMIEPVTLSLDATHVYSWGYDSTAHHTVLLQMPKTLQGNPITLAPSKSDNFLGLAAGQKFVYFAQPDGIYRIPASGGTPTFLAPSNRPVTSLALSKGALY